MDEISILSAKMYQIDTKNQLLKLEDYCSCQSYKRSSTTSEFYTKAQPAIRIGVACPGGDILHTILCHVLSPPVKS